MLTALFMLVAGLITLFIGGEALVRGSVLTAHRLGIPIFVTGVLIVGFGTSMPEMLVAIQAALAGAPELALGNVVGSNIANVLLVVGAAALCAPVLHDKGADARRGSAIALAVSVLLLVLALDGNLARGEGWLMLALLAIYMVMSCYYAARDNSAAQDERKAAAPDTPAATDSPAAPDSPDSIDAFLKKRFVLVPLLAIGGMVLLALGAEMLVDGATIIARIFGVSDAVIGLSLVAVGTSLPELMAVIIASIKRESGVVMGSVIGSNIFNILSILGVAVVLVPIQVPPRILATDIPLVIATAGGMLAMLYLLRRSGRLVGAGMLALYGLYLFSLFA